MFLFLILLPMVVMESVTSLLKVSLVQVRPPTTTMFHIEMLRKRNMNLFIIWLQILERSKIYRINKRISEQISLLTE